MTVVLQTIHGSHLYGLAHEQSDVDTYQVTTDVDSRFAHQNKEGDNDTLTISLGRFTEQVAQGVPQALEALWSPHATIAPEWAPFIRALNPSITETTMRYRHTIRNFAFNNGGRTGAARTRVDAVKLKRHALRLTLNLKDLNTTGRFNPHLTSTQTEWVKTMADSQRFEGTLEHLLGEAMFN